MLCNLLIHENGTQSIYFSLSIVLQFLHEGLPAYFLLDIFLDIPYFIMLFQVKSLFKCSFPVFFFANVLLFNILYQIALLLSLMIYLCSLLNLLTQSYHMQMMSFVSFLIFMPFGSFYYITVLGRTSSTLLKRSVNSRHSCCFPDLKENAFSISACLIFVADFFLSV